MISTATQVIIELIACNPALNFLEFIKPTGATFTSKNASGSTTLTDSDTDVTTGKTTNFTLTAGQYDASWDAGMVLPTGTASLGDRVWSDSNNNGTYEPFSGEQGINGVIVNLYRDTDSNGYYTPGVDQYYSTTTTYTAGGYPGYYEFTLLPAGNFVVQIDPVNFLSGKPLVNLLASTGSGVPPPNPNNGIDSDNNGYLLSGYGVVSRAITLTTVANPTLDFGFITQNSTVGNFVWLDSNANGIQDNGETGLSGVTVTLYDGNGNPVGSPVVTQSSGAYSFTSLTPGSYKVCFSNQPNGYLFSPTGKGTSSTDSNAGVTANGCSALFSLTSGETNNTLDAGLYQPVSVGDFVRLDTNHNGLQDSGEPGLAGVGITLYDAAGNTPVTTNAAGTTINPVTTDGTGIYHFTTLVPGQYTVKFIGPSGYASTLTNVGSDRTIDSNGLAALSAVMTSGQSDITLDSGFIDKIAIGNRVWNDNGAGTGGIANDGIQNGTEAGIGSVAVELYTGSGTFVTSTATDSTGHYYFDNLTPGTYYVKIPSTEFASGKPMYGMLSSTGADSTQTVDLNDNGIDNANPSANGILTNTFTLVVGSMPTGEDQTGYPGVLPDNSVNATDDLGFYTSQSIGNMVWNDNGAGSGGVGNDGIRNGTEPGLSNVVVQVLNSNGTVVDTQTTNINGYYRFDGLAPGTYTVVLPASNFTSGGSIVGFQSSTGQSTDFSVTGNNHDHGAASNGSVTSSSFTVGINPLNDMDSGATGAGSHGPSGDAGDSLILDFGLINSPELRIQKSVAISQPSVGRPFTYTLTVTKIGGTLTEQPQVIDTPPVGIKITAVAADANWVCTPSSALPLQGGSGVTVTYDRSGQMPDGAETITLTAVATATSGNLVNQATVTGDGNTPDTGHCDGSAAANCDKATVTPVNPQIGLVKKVSLAALD